MISARSVVAAKALLRKSLSVGGTAHNKIVANGCCYVASHGQFMAARSFVSRTGTQWMPIKTIAVS